MWSAVRPASDGSKQTKGIRSALAKLKRLLKNAERNQDYFALLSGVPAVMSVYTEDNQLVLSVILEACRVSKSLSIHFIGDTCCD
jgi:hypothetical protein